MKTTPIYHLKGTLYRSQEDLTNLVEVDEVFKDENLITAREKAFSIYENHIDVFCESKKEKYKSHEQAERLLKDFTDSYKRKFALDCKDLEIDIDSDKGLYIYLITDPSDTYTTKEGVRIYNKKILVHYIDNLFNNDKKYVFTALTDEFQYYKSKNLSVGKYEKIYNIPGLFKGNDFVSILETPIDFEKVFKEQN